MPRAAKMPETMERVVKELIFTEVLNEIRYEGDCNGYVCKLGRYKDDLVLEAEHESKNDLYTAVS